MEGHEGVLVLGRVAGASVAVMKGRAHFYEGWALEDVAFPVRVLAALGVGTLIVTAAVGSVRPSLKPGSLVALSDHINLMGANPLRGPHDAALGERFVSLTAAYDPKLRALAKRLAKREGMTVKEGVYVAMPGPSYETPAEIRMARVIGGHVVGMSTVPEVIAARQAGLRVLALTLVTNLGAGLSPHAATHEEVLEVAEKARVSFGRLLRRVLAEVGVEDAEGDRGP
ncbi:MAG: purine-nucleoside phosphorylase [Planctomycetes bacterium]|nr:purine-nucleoside phosphorylase [Planctomycetota bacterium]